MNCKTAHIFRTLIATALSIAFCVQAKSQRTDSLRYPIYDRYGDPYSNPNRNSFDLRDTAYNKRKIEYDPVTKQYYIVEKIGGKYYRTPTSFSMDDFLRLQGEKDEDEYFRRRSAMLADMNRRLFKPKFKTSNDWFNRIVGTGKIDIRPSGYVDILGGYQGQNINNPTIPERARKNGGLDFNMNAQLQVDANIGDKLKLPINYNTLANFEFENQLKLDYHGRDDEIVKQFQLGNVNFTSKGTLIPGAQSLFGVKTQLQFGKLFITGVLANQRAQRQSLGLEGGSATQTFALKADEYEENRHFLMAQYFRNNYNSAMKQLPIVNSQVQILRVEVWVTNRNVAATTDTRDIVGLMDLGESKPFNPSWGGSVDPKPSNGSNSLYATLISDPNNRNSALVQSRMVGLGMAPVQEFEKTFARKLQPSEYYFNPQIGFISLNQTLQPEEVLGIAFQYTYNGRTFQVGEFSQDVPPDSTGTSQKVLFLKLLKATSQRTNIPLWDLMMKNVYSVGFGQLERQDFDLNVLYEEPSLGEKRYLPPIDGEILPQYKGQPLLSLVNLDRLNNQNDPQQDGKFDFIEGFTVISSMSRIIFPVLEPFGHDLDYVYVNQAARDKYLFYPLYDTIKAIAQTYANLDRFKISGKSKTSSTGNADYQLGYNIPRGSVIVTAGGQTLQENVDYEINYDLGTLKVINQAIINSGVPVNIQYENQAAFGIQQRNYMGLRMDYMASKKLTIGGTFVKLGERPFFIKQSYGDDPIRNKMFGLDVDYKSDLPRLTKLLDKLPFYSTKEMSSISAYAEGAVLVPGHAPQIGKGTEGQVYIDDFEGTRSSIDLRFPLISWSLASTPQLYPESNLNNNLEYGFNRAKLAWYNIEPVLQERSNTNNPLRNDVAELSKPETRQVLQTEIFPERTNDFGQGLLTTFDLAYYPKDRGPYNFNVAPTANSAGLGPDGKLLNPRSRWGGIQRAIDQIDFETGNVEFIEFWLQDPFIKNTANPSGTGKLYINLGNISEDVLKDGKRQYENGLPTPTNNAPVDNNTVWGKVPANPLQVTNAFSNDANDRKYQDVGLDGLTDDEERTKFSSYVASVPASIAAKVQADPAADNFKPYRDPSFDQPLVGILGRYKDINNPHGNSPVADNNSQFVNAFTQYPDAEELNRDNTLNESEEYFQYKVDISPATLVPGTNFITDKRTAIVKLQDGSSRTENWYLFRIPIKEYESKVGNIPDFKSIRFIRMFVNGFDDSVVMRFGKFELVRNQWRKFQYNIDTTGKYVNVPNPDPVEFNTLAVNLEENDQREPIHYVIPPGIERQQQLSNNNVQLFLNEQSLSVQTCDLQKGQARGVFKTMNLDMRQYGKLMMFIHAEGRTSNDFIQDNTLVAVIRIGNDFQGNYYEVRIPLKKTNWGEKDSLKIWPEVNNLDFDLSLLTQLKSRRNNLGWLPSTYYSETLANGRTFGIIGNPNLGEVQGMLLAVENERNEPACAEVWFNELRLSHLDEKGGGAALARVDVKLADLGNINLSGTVKTRGFGNLEDKVNQRSKEDVYTFDFSSNIEAGKLLPKKLGLQIPMYAGLSTINSTPQYDPLDQDITLTQKLDEASSKVKRDSIRSNAQDVTTIKTLNFTNVKKLKTNGKRPKIWSVSNFDINYSYISTIHHDPLIENDELTRTRGALGYNYAPQPKFIEPFKKLIKSRSKWFTLIKDFNFNLVPTQLSFKADLFRQFGATRIRNIGGGQYQIPETYNKYFTFDRYYILQWSLTKSISLDYQATNNARIDEPFGRLDTKEKKDSVRNNLFKGGRNTQYQQSATLTYTVPTQKFPLLDWTTLRASYATRYNWLAASLLAKSLGNTLSNTQTRTLNGELNFEQLYNKSRFLRAVNTIPPQGGANKNGQGNDKNKVGDKNKPGAKNPVPQIEKPKNPFEISPDSLAKMSPKERRKAKKEMRKRARDERRRLRQERKNAPLELPGAVRAVGGIVTSLKRVGIQYTEDYGTTLPGYMDSTRVLGSNPKSGEPGMGFIFGYQPDTSWINRFGHKGLLSTDPLVSAMIQQRFNQRLNITAQVSPIRDLNVDINFDKTFEKQYSELYKDTLPGLGTAGLTRLSPYAMGSFSVSYISYQTLFEKFDPNVVSETFKTFEANRVLLSQRLGPKNPYSNGAIDPNGYYDGYGRYAQDVVIPAFLAAYTKKDPMKISLIKNDNPKVSSNPFAGIIPKPNWAISYNGLSKIPGLEKIFSNVTIRHGYHSTLSMNSFNTALLFQDPFHSGYPEFIDTTAGYRRFVPYFLVPNVTIQEQFDPLIEVDMTFTNQLSTRFEYRKSRTLSLSLIDYQLAENRSTEITVGVNWRKKGVPIFKNGVRLFKREVKLDNDVTFRFDFSLRDDATANSKLDQGTSFGTAGQKVVRIAPSIDYILNKRVSMKLYFEQNRNIPKISNAFPITNTRAGVQVRISLAQ